MCRVYYATSSSQVWSIGTIVIEVVKWEAWSVEDGLIAIIASDNSNHYCTTNHCFAMCYL